VGERADSLTPGAVEHGNPLDDLALAPTTTAPTPITTAPATNIERLWEDATAVISKLRSETGGEVTRLRKELVAALGREAQALREEALAKEEAEVAKDGETMARRSEELAKESEREAKLDLGREKRRRERDEERWLKKEEDWRSERAGLNQRVRELEAKTTL
jgi:hypothetical protein